MRCASWSFVNCTKRIFELPLQKAACVFNLFRERLWLLSRLVALKIQLQLSRTPLHCTGAIAGCCLTAVSLRYLILIGASVARLHAYIEQLFRTLYSVQVWYMAGIYWYLILIWCFCCSLTCIHWGAWAEKIDLTFPKRPLTSCLWNKMK